MVKDVLTTWLQPGNTYTRFLPQLDPRECIRRHGVLQGVSRFMFSVYLRLLVLLDLKQVDLKFLVQLLLPLQFRVDSNKFFLSSL